MCVFSPILHKFQLPTTCNIQSASETLVNKQVVMSQVAISLPHHVPYMCPTCMYLWGVGSLAATTPGGPLAFVSRIAAFDDEGVLRINEANTAVTYGTIGMAARWGR